MSSELKHNLFVYREQNARRLDIVRDYPHRLSSRIAYYIVAMSVLGTFFIGLTSTNIFANFLKGKTCLFLIISTATTTFLVVFILHEMTIFLQYFKERFSLIDDLYRTIYELKVDSAERIQCERELNNMLGKHVNVFSYLFIILINLSIFILPPVTILIAINGINKIGYYYHFLIAFDAVMFLAYIISAFSFKKQYYEIRKMLDVGVWKYAILHDLKCPGKKRNKILQKTKKCEYLEEENSALSKVKKYINHNAKGNNVLHAFKEKLKETKTEEAETNEFSFAQRLMGLFSSYDRLNKFQKETVIKAIKPCWFKSNNKASIEPKAAFIDITEKCNYSCYNCYSRDLTHCKDMQYNDLSAIIDKLMFLGVRAIIFTGGEPTLHEKMIDICLDKQDLLFFFFTNGSKITPEYVKLIYASHNIIPIISVDGTREYTDLRRGKGAYDTCLHAATLFNEMGIGFGISATVYFTNAENLKNTFLKEINNQLQPSFVVYLLMATITNKDNEYINPSSYVKFVKKVDSHKNPIFIAELPFDEIYFSQNNRTGSCIAGRRIIHIDVDGNIHKCPFVRSLSKKPILQMSAEEINYHLKNCNESCNRMGGIISYMSKKKQHARKNSNQQRPDTYKCCLKRLVIKKHNKKTNTISD
ncbi:radical SAM protein [Chryseobacterium sp.]|uniref:radical SAM protein n=1 Tax=Chryseobacterium sp. TaxID=1871047 RepID=UPI002FC81719